MKVVRALSTSARHQISRAIFSSQPDLFSALGRAMQRDLHFP
jgi:hypothetical protein